MSGRIFPRPSRPLLAPWIVVLASTAACTQLLNLDGPYWDQEPDASAGAPGDASSEHADSNGSGGASGASGAAGQGGSDQGGMSGSAGASGAGGSSGQGGTAGQGGASGAGGASGNGGASGQAGAGGADAGPPVMCSSSSTLEALVSCIVTAMPKAGSEGYVPPGTQALADWRSAVASMMAGSCDFVLPASLAAMTLRPFHDSGDGKTYCAMWEIVDGNDDGIVDRGWGTFIVNPSASKDLFSSAPHPLTDLNTETEAVSVFKMVAARGLILAGAARSANAATSSCQSTYGQADVAHNASTMYQATHEALLTHYGATPFHVIQWHGMSATTCASEVYMTHGVVTAPGAADKISLLRTAMLSHHPSWCIEVPGTTCTGGQPCDQTATTNVQGRLLNGVAAGSVCSQSAASATGQFVSAEQDPNFRAPGDWAQSVTEVWP